MSTAPAITPPVAAALIGFAAALISSAGQTFLIGLYVDSIIEAFHQPRVVVTAWYAGATAVAALLLAPAGRLADLWSPERFLLVVLACVISGIAFLASASAGWHVFAAFTLLRLCGQGGVGVAILSLVARRFQDGWGWLLSRAQLGHPAGELLLPLAVASLIGAVGWRGSLWTLALVWLLLVGAITWLLPRVTPRRAHHAPAEIAEVPVRPSDGVTLREAVRGWMFWCTALAFSVPPIVFTALVFHQVAVFNAVGIGAGWVPLALACVAVGQVVTTWTAGRFADAMTVRLAAVVSSVTTAAAVLTLVLPGPPEARALTYGALLGVAVALSALGGALAVPVLFGTRALGSLRSVSSALRNGATAAAPLLLTLGIGDESLIAGVWILAVVSGVGVAAGVVLPAKAHRSRWDDG